MTAENPDESNLRQLRLCTPDDPLSQAISKASHDGREAFCLHRWIRPNEGTCAEWGFVEHDENRKNARTGSTMNERTLWLVLPHSYGIHRSGGLLMTEEQMMWQAQTEEDKEIFEWAITHENPRIPTFEELTALVESG